MIDYEAPGSYVPLRERLTARQAFNVWRQKAFGLFGASEEDTWYAFEAGYLFGQMEAARSEVERASEAVTTAGGVGAGTDGSDVHRTTDAPRPAPSDREVES